MAAGCNPPVHFPARTIPTGVERNALQILSDNRYALAHLQSELFCIDFIAEVLTFNAKLVANPVMAARALEGAKAGERFHVAIGTYATQTHERRRAPTSRIEVLVWPETLYLTAWETSSSATLRQAEAGKIALIGNEGVGCRAVSARSFARWGRRTIATGRRAPR